MSYIGTKFRKVTKKKEIEPVSMMSYIRAKFRKVTKKISLACEHDVIYKG